MGEVFNTSKDKEPDWSKYIETYSLEYLHLNAHKLLKEVRSLYANINELLTDDYIAWQWEKDGVMPVGTYFKMRDKAKQ